MIQINYTIDMHDHEILIKSILIKQYQVNIPVNSH